MTITTVDSASDPDSEPTEITAIRATEGEPEADEPIIPPVAEVTDESLSAPVVQPQTDEFVCTECFLVHHHTQRGSGTEDLCRDCV